MGGSLENPSRRSFAPGGELLRLPLCCTRGRRTGQPMHLGDAGEGAAGTGPRFDQRVRSVAWVLRSKRHRNAQVGWHILQGRFSMFDFWCCESVLRDESFSICILELTPFWTQTTILNSEMPWQATRQVDSETLCDKLDMQEPQYGQCTVRASGKAWHLFCTGGVLRLLLCKKCSQGSWSLFLQWL